MKRHLFCSDKDVARVLEVSTSTITRQMNGSRNGKYDLRLVNPIKVGGSRRWNIITLANVLGVSVEDLEKAIFG